MKNSENYSRFCRCFEVSTHRAIRTLAHLCVRTVCSSTTKHRGRQSPVLERTSLVGLELRDASPSRILDFEMIKMLRHYRFEVSVSWDSNADSLALISKGGSYCCYAVGLSHPSGSLCNEDGALPLSCLIHGTGHFLLIFLKCHANSLGVVDGINGLNLHGFISS